MPPCVPMESSWLDLFYRCFLLNRRKGGQMFPDAARLYVAGIEDAEYKEEKSLGLEMDINQFHLTNEGSLSRWQEKGCLCKQKCGSVIYQQVDTYVNFGQRLGCNYWSSSECAQQWHSTWNMHIEQESEDSSFGHFGSSILFRIPPAAIFDLLTGFGTVGN